MIASTAFAVIIAAVGIAAAFLMIRNIMKEGAPKANSPFNLEKLQEAEYLKVSEMMQEGKTESELLRCGCLVKSYERMFGPGIDTAQLFEELAQMENRVYAKVIPPHDGVR